MKELITDYLLNNSHDPEKIKKGLIIQRESVENDHPYYKIRMGENGDSEWVDVEIHEILNWLYLKIKNN